MAKPSAQPKIMTAVHVSLPSILQGTLVQYGLHNLASLPVVLEHSTQMGSRLAKISLVVVDVSQLSILVAPPVFAMQRIVLEASIPMGKLPARTTMPPVLANQWHPIVGPRSPVIQGIVVAPLMRTERQPVKTSTQHALVFQRTIPVSN
jgi:hypothetical protein